MGKSIDSIEAKRLEALKNYQILDSFEEEEFDRITEQASLICDTPIALISLIDEDRQWFKSKVGLSQKETSRELAFCRYAIKGEDILEVVDATQDERFKNNELVMGDPKIRFYAGQPLIDPNGFALGTLCVIAPEPKKLNKKQARMLQLLAQHTMDLIVQRRQKADLKNFQNLFELSNDLICIAGTDGFFKKINPAFKKILGWDEAVLLTTSFYALVHPDDLLKTQAEIKGLAEGHNTINFTHRFKTEQNEYKTLQWVATPEPLTGNLFAIARDITEEKAKEHQLVLSEERARAFFENSQGFMCTHDLEGKLLSVNGAGAVILGYSLEEILKMTLFDIVPKSNHTNIRTYLQRVSQKGRDKGQMITLTKHGVKRIWMYNNILEHSVDGTKYVIGNAVDITEKQQLEDDLRKTKEILEQTNRVAKVGGWELDVETQNISWTSITKEIHDTPEDYAPSLHEAINFYKEGTSRENISAAVHEAITKGTPWNIELQIITFNGKELWVRAIGAAEFEDGQCKRLFGTFQDIDEEKRAEIEVRSSRKMLDDVLQAASGVSIIATDLEGTITVFNTGAEKLLGYSAEEMVGKQKPEIIHLAEEVAERGRELTKLFGFNVEGFRVFVQQTEVSGSEQREWTYVRKDGSLRKVSLFVTAIKNIDQQITGYLGVGIDITEQRTAERALIMEKARLASFVQFAPAAVAMLDNEMKFIAVSNRWIEDYQLIDTNIIGQSYYDVFENIDEEQKTRHRRILSGAVERKEEDNYGLKGDDKVQYMTWQMRPWNDFDGKIGGMMIFTQDITSIIRQREELKLAKKFAEEANVAKSEFLANMSHEIRTPLNGVIGFTDLMLKTQLNDTQHQYVNIINQSGNALLSIINDILDFSKIEAGKLELDIEKCDLYELACQATDIITYQAQTKGLEMLLNIPPDLPRFIYADSVRIRQVLVNLLGNAAKFTEKGEIELKIEKVSGKEKETTLCFSVRDTGIGIREDKQQKIFEAFSQEDSSTTKKYGGTGLGLTISNKLLGLMGSKLELSSTLGQGSTFDFTITFKSENGEPLVWEDISEVKNALVVDDNENNRHIISAMLSLRNIRTTEAANGFEALQLLAKKLVYDVIIMDYRMPYMDGLETIGKIRKTFFMPGARQPIILLHSSSDDARMMKEYEGLDIAHRLIKPVKMQDIYHALSRLHHKALKPKQAKGHTQHKVDLVVKVMIVEDNPVNMLLAQTIVENMLPSADLIMVGDGLEAIEVCEKQLPDIVFMDIQMPQMNGYDATKELRKIFGKRQIPIVALTAGNVKGEREKCLEAGMDDFLVKPIIENDIAGIFDKWLDTKSADSDGILDTETDSKAHFDISTLLSFLGTDKSMLKDVIKLVIQELQSSKLSIEHAVKINDLVGLKGEGHKLYGTAASCLPNLALLANHLEHQNENETAGMTETVKAILEEIDVALLIIENWKATGID